MELEIQGYGQGIHEPADVLNEWGKYPMPGTYLLRARLPLALPDRSI